MLFGQVKTLFHFGPRKTAADNNEDGRVALLYCIQGYCSNCVFFSSPFMVPYHNYTTVLPKALVLDGKLRQITVQAQQNQSSHKHEHVALATVVVLWVRVKRSVLHQIGGNPGRGEGPLLLCKLPLSCRYCFGAVHMLLYPFNC